MSKNLSPAELYAEQFQSSEPKYFTMVPNILDHLTYTIEENGIKTKKRLSVYAKQLYLTIRSIASDDGADWNCTESLADKVGCSVGAIINAKKELLMPMDQLEGSPLIIEKRKSIRKKTQEGKSFSVILCTRTIIDIWKWNNAFMATLKYQKKNVRNNDTDSCGESVPSTDSCGESVSLGTDSCGECNNNSLNKNPLFLEQQPTADAAPVCVSKKKKERLSLSEEQRQSYEWMLAEGCDEKAAYDMASKFSGEDIKLACKYVLMQEKVSKSKHKKIFNPWGYFRQTLKGRYWENGKSKR